MMDLISDLLLTGEAPADIRLNGCYRSCCVGYTANISLDFKQDLSCEVEPAIIPRNKSVPVSPE